MRFAQSWVQPGAKTWPCARRSTRLRRRFSTVVDDRTRLSSRLLARCLLFRPQPVPPLPLPPPRHAAPSSRPTPARTSRPHPALAPAASGAVHTASAASETSRPCTLPSFPSGAASSAASLPRVVGVPRSRRTSTPISMALRQQHSLRCSVRVRRSPRRLSSRNSNSNKNNHKSR